MVPPFIIDLPLLFFVGLFSAYFVSAGARPPMRSRAFKAGAFICLALTGLAYYQFLKAPDWMFLYFIPSQQVSTLVTLGLFLAYPLFYFLGFIINIQLKKIHIALCILMIFIGTIFTGAITIPFATQYQTVASYEDFQRGQGVLLNESDVGRNTRIPSFIILIVGTGLIMWARRESHSSEQLISTNADDL